jgi:hypothetical protein
MVLFRFNERAWVVLTLLVSNNLLVKADLLSGGLRGIEGLDDNDARDLKKKKKFGLCESGCDKDKHCLVSSEGYTFVLLSAQGSPVEYLLGSFAMSKAPY